LSEKKEVKKNIYPRDSRVGMEFAFGGVACKLIEVNKINHPFTGDSYTVAYKIIDTRVVPAFESPVAHLFLNPNSNVLSEIKEVVDHYNEIRENIFKIKIPKEEEKK
jgi:hypothetical protein